MKTIGFLVATTSVIWKKYKTAFENQLTSLHWTINTDVKIDYQEAGGLQAKYDSLAAQFVTNQVDVIVTSGTAPALACKKATNAAVSAGQQPIPVVFASVGDPVDCGLVKTLKQPGGNLTGLCNEQINLVYRRVDFIREELSQDLSPIVVGVIGNDTVSTAKLEMRIAMQAASDFGLTAFQGNPIRTAADIPTVINDLKTKGVNVLFVCSDPVITTNADILNQIAKTANMGTMHAFREYVDDHHGLLFYGPSFQDMFKGAAVFVDQILRGANPAQLPVVGQHAFEHGRNRATAKALGLKHLQ
jgi:putative ABC transport system substrate-binding protein